MERPISVHVICRQRSRKNAGNCGRSTWQSTGGKWWRNASAMPLQRAGGYSFNTAVLYLPSSSTPIVAARGNSLRIMFARKCTGSSVKLSVRRPVRLVLTAPKRPWAHSRSAKPGRRRSSWTNGSRQMLAADSSAGSPGCSKMPSPSAIARSIIAWRLNPRRIWPSWICFISLSDRDRSPHRNSRVLMALGPRRPLAWRLLSSLPLAIDHVQHGGPLSIARTKPEAIASSQNRCVDDLLMSPHVLSITKSTDTTMTGPICLRWTAWSMNHCRSPGLLLPE